jgi:hypothetical protein
MAWPIDTQVRDYVGSLALVPPEAPENRWHMPKAERELTSEVDLVRMMVTDASVVSMAHLAARCP